MQMLAPTLGKFSAMGLKDYEAFDLPYLFDNFEQVHQVTQGPTGKQLLDQLEPKGLKGLAFWDNGFKQMNANKALRVPADFKGVKLRIFSSKVLDAQMRALGAIPQVLAASEMYQAMQTGLVDGNENTESTFYDFKLYEVQKYLTHSSHGYVGYLVVANKKFSGRPAGRHPQGHGRVRWSRPRPTPTRSRRRPTRRRSRASRRPARRPSST